MLKNKKKLLSLFGLALISSSALFVFGVLNVWKGSLDDDGEVAGYYVVPKQYECRECGTIDLIPRPKWVPQCRMNEDKGQKDGTGKTGADRKYLQYDYDRGEVIDVPPYFLNSQGLLTNPLQPLPQITPQPDVPCGWPSIRNISGGRWVSQQCAASTPVAEMCPYGPADPAINVNSSTPPRCTTARNGTTPVPNHDGYQAIDIAGFFRVYSTMSGTAYRCIESVQTFSPPCSNYGVFVRVVGTNGYTTRYAHLAPESGETDTTPPGASGSSSICGTGNRLVRTTIVSAGDFIGTVGLTGCTTGAHLHYEITQGGTRVCPATFMDYRHPNCGGITTLSTLSNGVVNVLNQLNPFRDNAVVEEDNTGLNLD